MPEKNAKVKYDIVSSGHECQSDWTVMYHTLCCEKLKVLGHQTICIGNEK